MKNVVTSLALLLVCWTGFAQSDSTQNQISVVARPSPDSIVLRWAPLHADAWIRSVRDGFTIERYTLVRDNKIVNPPEKKQLSPSVILPWPLERWELLVQDNKYAAIAAQALFGSDFEMSMDGADVFQIVNKVQENMMRFSFALYAADLSVPVSIALGLRLTDKDVRKDEKYLYRIFSIHQGDTIRGSLFTGPGEYSLPQPLDFSAEFKGNIVSLKWDQSYHKGIYTAYIVERAEQDGEFVRIADDALVTLTPEDKPETRYQYATDSLPEANKEYAYRVRGLTPFGEIGPPSDTVRGRGAVIVRVVPYITEDNSPDNQVIDLKWEFPVSVEAGIKGFEVRRSSNPKVKPKTIHPHVLGASIRSFRDHAPEQNNYYQVIALGLAGEEFKSPLRLSQLVDSIPPAAPTGLLGQVDENGMATLQWKPNQERDIYGYRIYRGNNRKAEFSQVTTEPIARAGFVDSVNLNTLDRFIYYQVMAIDRNQNHSDLSDILEIPLPDKIPPVPPVFLPVTASQEGVWLQWVPSSSDDVHHYAVYTQPVGRQEWTLMATVPHTEDSILSYRVAELEEGIRMNFTLVAVDGAGLESVPCAPVTASRLVNPIKPAVIVSAPEVNREEKLVRIKWVYQQQGVARYQIYRAREGEAIRLYQTIPSGENSFTDRQLVVNSKYAYQVVALFSSGARSALSEEIIVNY